MFVHDVPLITKSSWVGRYQSPVSIGIGSKHVLPVCNIQGSADFPSLEFSINWYQKRMYMLPDMMEPNRRTFAFRMHVPDYKLLAISQGILAYRFNLTDDAITVVGREFPEMFPQVKFSALFQDTKDERHYKALFLDSVDDPKQTHISETEYFGTELIPIPEYCRPGVSNLDDGRNRMLIIGNGTHLVSMARFGKNTVVYVNPELEDWKKSTTSFPVWCKEWFHNGLSNNASMNLCSLTTLRKKFEPDGTLKQWFRSAFNLSTRFVFIGYPYTDIIEVRKVIASLFQ